MSRFDKTLYYTLYTNSSTTCSVTRRTRNQSALFSALLHVRYSFTRARLYIRNRESKLFEARKWSRVSRAVTSTSQRGPHSRLFIHTYIHTYAHIHICTCTPTHVSASYCLVLLLCTVLYLPTRGYRRRFSRRQAEQRRRRHVSQRETNKIVYGNCFRIIIPAAHMLTCYFCPALNPLAGGNLHMLNTLMLDPESASNRKYLRKYSLCLLISRSLNYYDVIKVRERNIFID